MLHKLYQRRSLETLNVAYELGSWVHPQLLYMVVTPKKIDFVLQDERTITLTATGDGELVIIEPPPVQQQYREIHNVDVTDTGVYIMLNKLVHVQFQKDGQPVTEVEWALTTNDDPRLRRALTNRFTKNGAVWHDDIDIENFSIWREYDVTSTVDREETDE